MKLDILDHASDDWVMLTRQDQTCHQEEQRDRHRERNRCRGHVSSYSEAALWTHARKPDYRSRSVSSFIDTPPEPSHLELIRGCILQERLQTVVGPPAQDQISLPDSAARSRIPP